MELWGQTLENDASILDLPSESGNTNQPIRGRICPGREHADPWDIDSLLCHGLHYRSTYIRCQESTDTKCKFGDNLPSAWVTS